MGFLQTLLTYPRICIQCHNNPDADSIASAFGVYLYLQANGVEASIVYGGPVPIKKNCLKLLLSECGIPITYTHAPAPYDLLLMVDCQYGQGNAECFPADRLAIIDHHIPTMAVGEQILINSTYQSCATLVWELLQEEHFPIAAYPALSVALLYGLYTDTASYTDLYQSKDMEMRSALFSNQPLFERLIKSNMTFAELMVATDALHDHYFDVTRRFAIVEALSCDQTILGVIGDFMIQVDIVYLSLSYTEAGAGYRISLRSCHESLEANQIAAFICRDIGTGGGHLKKAGGYIQKSKIKERYGDISVFELLRQLLCSYIDEHRTY